MATIGFISLGCAKNQVDCERMMFRVQEAGYTVSDGVVDCDVVVINTCGFIDSAKSEAIDHILRVAELKKAGRVGKILVTGCLSQRYPDEIRQELPEVDGVLGTGSYTEIVPAIEELLEDKHVENLGSIDAPEVETGRIMTTPAHYAYIKIAEGCDNRCAYCIIPYLRGRYRSRQMDDVLYEARMLAESGVKELIVVAQDTSRYGTDLPGEGEAEFAELCEFLKKQRMERVGAFPFSPEEGTPAAKMDYPDSDVAQQRAEMVEEIQSRIMDDYNASMIGKTLEVLVDGFDEDAEQFYGRTYADSPDIDGRVWIACDEPLTVGDFVQVTIDAVEDGDLCGYVAEE